MTDKNRAELIQQILEMQKQVIHYIRNYPPNIWLSLNLTIAQLKCLIFIAYSGSTNFKELAKALGVSPPNVTGIIERMLEQGLVSREENPDNRRMQVLKVTPKGDELLTGLRTSGDAKHSMLLNRLDEADLEALARGLNAMVRATKQP